MTDSTTGSLLGNCCLHLFKLIFILGLSILIWWLIFHPQDIKLYINSAELRQFSLTATANSSAFILRYNLTFDLSARNPNRRIGVYYDLLEATAFFSDQLLQSTELPTFFQHTKSTTRLRPAFGHKATDVGPTTAADFQREERKGAFDLYVKLHAKLRFKILFIKVSHFKRNFDCMAMNVAAPANDSVAGSVVFPAGTKCGR